MTAMRTVGEPTRSSELSLLRVVDETRVSRVLLSSFCGTDKELHVLG